MPPGSRLLLGFLVAELGLFVFAPLVHRGAILRGHQHGEAAIAETLIAIVLATGLVLSLLRPCSTRGIALLVQILALVGTLVGVVTIMIGVGPRTPLDLTLRALMLITLAAGLIAAARVRIDPIEVHS